MFHPLKIFGFLTFSGGIEMEHWAKIDFKQVSLDLNIFNTAFCHILFPRSSDNRAAIFQNRLLN